MAYKKIKSYEVHQDNPFVEKAVQEIKTVRKTQFVGTTSKGNKAEVQLVNSEGELEGYAQFFRIIEVDEEKFAKLFVSEFAAFWELTTPAIKVFGYIINVLKKNSDRFIFRLDECLGYTHYKNRKDVMNGIACLIDCGIIARTRYDYEYFINPMVLFNGDRVVYAKAYVKRKKKELLTPNQLELPLTAEPPKKE